MHLKMKFQETTAIDDDFTTYFCAGFELVELLTAFVLENNTVQMTLTDLSGSLTTIVPPLSGRTANAREKSYAA